MSQIAVYRGDKRSSVEDTLLGKVLIPLKFLLNGKEVRLHRHTFL